jgi:hypothetical protein
MAITPPAFQKDAVPSLKGWHHPKTNELLKSTRHTQAQIDEFNGITAVESPIAIEIAEVVEDVVTLRWEQPVVIAEGIIDSTNDIPDDLEAMTKRQLEEYARGFGVELDLSLSRKALLDEVLSLVKR